MSEPLAICELDEGEIVQLHDDLALTMRRIGLTGHALDEAISGAFRAAIPIIDRERVASRKRDNIRVVQ